MVSRAKKKKKAKIHRPAKSGYEIVKMADYLNLAVMVRNLKTMYNWENEQIEEFVEGYIAQMIEIGPRNTAEGIIQDAKELTGIDVRAMLEQVFDRR